MAYQEINGFLGVNLRKDRLSLADQEMAKAINADLSSFLGVLRARNGTTKQFATALPDLIVRYIRKVGDNRYRVAGQSLYRNETRVLSGGLSSNLKTTIVPYRPVLDTATWAFVADDAVMKKDDGTNLYKWGIAAPDTPLAFISIGLLSGEYSMRMTHYRKTASGQIAHESNPCAIGATYVLSNNTIVLYNLPVPSDPQVTGYGFYRTVANGADHFLEARLDIPTQSQWSVTHPWEAVDANIVDLVFEWAKTAEVALGTGVATIFKPKLPKSAGDDATVGTKAWSNPNYIKASDNSRATISASSSTQSHYLTAKNFNFSIPSGAIISGIEVEIERSSAGTTPANTVDAVLKLIKGGAISGSDKADTTTAWTTSDAKKVYGSSSDLWGLSLTPEDINAKDFGVALSVTVNNSKARVDAVKITVYTGTGTVGGEVRVSQAFEGPNDPTPSEDVNGRRGTSLFEITDGYVTTETPKLFAYATALDDSGLGTIVTTDNNPPPEASFARLFQESIFLLGDTDNPNYLWWSKRLQPEAYPLTNYVEVGSVYDPLQGAVIFAEILAVFSRNTKYAVTGSVTNGFSATEGLSHRGTRSPDSLLATQQGIVFVSDDGVFLTTLVSTDDCLSDDIAPLFQNREVNGYKPVNQAAADRIRTAYWKRRLYMAYPSGSSAENDMLAVFSEETGKWYFYDLAVSALEAEPDTAVLAAGGQDGFAYVLEDGSASVSLSAESKDYFGESKETRKLFRAFKVDANTDGGSLTAQFIVDGTVRSTKTITGSRTKLYMNVSDQALGYSWRIAISYTGTKKPEIYGIGAEYVNLEAA